MKLISFVLACVTIVLLTVACTETVTPTNTSTPTGAAPAPSASVDELANARANYAKNCEACHGPKGEGGLVKVDNKRIKVASLKAEHAIKQTDEKLMKTITAGEEEMPAFKDKMKQEEIAEMVRFIRKNFQGK